MEKLWYPGVNMAADAVVFAIDPEQEHKPCVLLIERGGDSGAETGRLAFPGGFLNTSAPKGAPFVMDVETPRQAASRELDEEASLQVDEKDWWPVGVYDDPKRDPRNEPGVSQVVSHAWATFTVCRPIQARDDARRARWVRLDQLNPSMLAFDHGKILEDAKTVLSRELAVLGRLGESLESQFNQAFDVPALKNLPDPPARLFQPPKPQDSSDASAQASSSA